MSKQPAKPVLYQRTNNDPFEELPIMPSSVKFQMDFKNITLGKDKGLTPEESFIYLENTNQHFRVASMLFPDGSYWNAHAGWKETDLSYDAALRQVKAQK